MINTLELREWFRKDWMNFDNKSSDGDYPTNYTTIVLNNIEMISITGTDLNNLSCINICLKSNKLIKIFVNPIEIELFEDHNKDYEGCLYDIYLEIVSSLHERDGSLNECVLIPYPVICEISQ